jgi:hypothetical protein
MPVGMSSMRVSGKPNEGVCSGLRLVQLLEADQRARQLHEPKQDVGVPLVAGLQAPAAQQPRQRPLRDLPVAAELVVARHRGGRCDGVMPRWRSARRQRGSS